MVVGYASVIRAPRTEPCVQDEAFAEGSDANKLPVVGQRFGYPDASDAVHNQAGQVGGSVVEVLCSYHDAWYSR